jgi:hypothetical protein
MPGPDHEAVDRPGLHLVQGLEEMGASQRGEFATRPDLDPSLRIAVHISEQTRGRALRGDVSETVPIVAVVVVTAVGPTPVHAEAAASHTLFAEDGFEVSEQVTAEGNTLEIACVGCRCVRPHRLHAPIWS